MQRVLTAVSAEEQVVVVAAALIRGGRVLVGERNHPPALAGMWEFPGGKVEKGETFQGALARECQEELGIEVVVGPEIGRERLADGAALILFDTRALNPDQEPQPLEHRALKWLEGPQLAAMAWLPANQPFIAEVIRRL
jgi:8-oxo-dGTP diphosphatase